MSKSQHATRMLNRIGFFLPLFLAFLLAADAAIACPQHSGKVGYRTTKLSKRTAAPMATTVITYRAPRSYRRCGDNLIDTRGARYVASRSDSYRNGARYVAVRNGDVQYKKSRTRYIAVRDVDRYEAPRYMSVRRPVYRESSTRYVAVLDGHREKLVPAREIADVYDDDVRYVKVRRAPVYREQVAYYEAPRTRYVRVRNIDSGCARVVARRGCPDQVGTLSTRRVVLRDDDAYETRTKYVAVRDEIEEDDYDRDEVVYDRETDYVSASVDDVDDEYVAPPAALVSSTNYIDDDDAYLMTHEVESPYMRQVAVRTYPETYGTRTVSYRPVSHYNDDIDDQAFLDGGGATYVAAGDFEDACLKRTAVYEEPVAMSTRDVRYVPVDDVDDYAFHGGSAETFVEVRQPAVPVAYTPVDQDVDYIDSDVAYVATDDVDYVEAETASYAPARQVEYVETEPVSYVDDANMYVAEDDCVAIGVAEARPMYVADNSIVMVEEADSALLGLSPTVHRIARTLGFNEGYEDGLDDAQDGDDYEPSDGGAQGYKRHYGDKDVYRGVYRSAYHEGYQAGFKALEPAL